MTPYAIKMDGFTLAQIELPAMTPAERDVVRRQIANEYLLQHRFIRLVEVKNVGT